MDSADMPLKNNLPEADLPETGNPSVPTTDSEQRQEIEDLGSKASSLIPDASSFSEERPARRGLHLFCPDRLVESVLEVKVEDLRAGGIRGVILDLDNTLVRWQKEDISEEIMAWLELLKAGGFQLCILSNSILSRRSERIAERLGCPNVRQARKPRRKGFLRAMEAMGTKPHETAIVGDQMFTDILGGNRSGIYTIMVRPIHHHEFVYTRFVSRPPERFLLKLFKRRGHI